MPIDPLDVLALSLQRTKGAYALLIGSGVSRPAGIPTGYEVAVDLVRKLAGVSGETTVTDAEAWYAEHVGGEPDYAALLDSLAKTPAERRQLLRAYFEPSDEEKEAGLKVPTRAHRAIADLVRRGHVRVILTTNFDRLIEQAIADAGLVPTVIPHAEALAGAMPLVHEQITVVKLHGDYVDTRLRNTTSELAEYEPALNTLLDRILDEFGLIVCGWSAAWDTALRNAIERCPNHRFTTWWTEKGPRLDPAVRLAAHRRAEIIPIESADQFFEAIGARVQALDDLGAPPPPSREIAVATAKRYLADPVHRIRLHDLVVGETERAVSALLSSESLGRQPGGTWEEARAPIRAAVAAMDAATEVLAALATTGVYWGGAEYTILCVRTIERLGNLKSGGSTTSWWTHLQRYPALLVFYAGGMGAVAADKSEALVTLLLRPRLRTWSGEQGPPLVLTAERVILKEAGRQLPDLDRHKFPGSDYLHARLRPILRDLVPDGIEYERLFDRWEYLLGLAEIGWPGGDGDVHGSVGRFSWRTDVEGFNLFSQIEAEAKTAGAAWPLLAAGFFGGRLEEFLERKARFDGHARMRGHGHG